MPILDNPRHERFVQEVHKGKAASAAYKKAGFEAKGNAAEVNASKLLRNAKVAARLKELQGRAVERTEITVDSLKDMYLEDRRLAHSLGQISAAKGAADSLAKIFGHWVDKSENTSVVHVITDEPVSEDDWAAEHVGHAAN